MKFAWPWWVTFLAFLTWSGVAPYDRLTWWMEVLPAIMAFVVMLYTRKHFPLTPLLNLLILIHCIILVIGGHYTYALVPVPEWISESLGWTRNNYDKLGHFAQGFVPAMAARELFIRLKVVREGAWLHFLVVCVALAISAFYELVEWWAALFYGGEAEAFLGTQGYVWDTQSDMLLALLGAISALLLLSKVHNRQLYLSNQQKLV